ncbi:MAG: hypothetical protein J07HX5_01535 [halophilic archaeon J07HX5]|nr:MAG: hypothetical protein J07HX5_01535 [halophilic archaeon J07HX5]
MGDRASSSRRQYLAAVTAVATTLAGCSGLQDGSDDAEPSQPNTSDESTGQPDTNASATDDTIHNPPTNRSKRRLRAHRP